MYKLDMVQNGWLQSRAESFVDERQRLTTRDDEYRYVVIEVIFRRCSYKKGVEEARSRH